MKARLIRNLIIRNNIWTSYETAIVLESFQVIERVRLDQFDDKKELMEAVMSIPYNGRGTRTNDALGNLSMKKMSGLIYKRY